jgi:hypothetical protein
MSALLDPTGKPFNAVFGESGEISSDIPLYDHEIDKVDRVLAKLAEKQGKQGIYLEGYRREIVERFADHAGLHVGVNVWSTNYPGLYWWDIKITGRVEDGEFDHDRQVHEVTNNILNIPGEEGVLNTNAEYEPPDPRHKHCS